MAEFLTTTGTSYHIEKIITEADKKLILVSPYLQLSKTLYERLLDASMKRVRITIIFGKDELKPNERKSLANLENLNLLFFENLHAKCYFNEKEMVITSMNMYEFSEKNNREMGVFVTRLNDEHLFQSAVNETYSIIQSSNSISLKVNNHNRNSTIKRGYYIPKIKDTRGYCIRCEERIYYNPDSPYCRDCFSIWYQFENYEYEENVCHSCGRPGVTSMGKPECYTCYNR